MPSPGTYPTPTAFGGPGGPQWTYFNEVEPTYLTDEFVNQDGSVDLLQWADAGARVREFEFTYEGLLDETDAAILDNHYDAAEGTFLPFTFVHPRGGGTFTSNTHYKEYKRSHENGPMGRQRQIRTVRLIVRPA